MGGIIARRLVAFAPVLVFTSMIVFGLLHLSPGDPVDVIVGEDRPSAEIIAQIRADLGLDQPLPVQYWNWLSRAVQGDFGYSYRSRRPVMQVVAERLPLTLELTGLSIVFGLAVALPLGIVAALNRGKWPDAVATALAGLGTSMPAYWLGILLIYAFSLGLHLLPPSGYVRINEDLGQNLRYMILPVFTLGSAYSSVMIRFVRASLLEHIGMDYIRTARAKGLAEPVVVRRHLIRNALIPIVTVLGVETGRLLGGAILTETIFALPGLGRLAVDSILSRDFPTMQATVAFMTLAVLGSNLVVDVAYNYIDPRIRVQ